MEKDPIIDIAIRNFIYTSKDTLYIYVYLFIHDI